LKPLAAFGDRDGRIPPCAARFVTVKQIRVLVALKSRLYRELLGESLRNELMAEADVLLMDERRGSQDLSVWARDCDVVFATIEPTQDIPELVTGLLAQFPNLLVVGIPPLEGPVRTYFIDVRKLASASPKGIASAIMKRVKKSNGLSED
jgi:hypothetical protein